MHQRTTRRQILRAATALTVSAAASGGAAQGKPRYETSRFDEHVLQGCGDGRASWGISHRPLAQDYCVATRVPAPDYFMHDPAMTRLPSGRFLAIAPCSRLSDRAFAR